MSQFKVWQPEHGDEDTAEYFDAPSPIEAAEAFGERTDFDNDYSIASGCDATVHVRDLKTNEVHRCIVSAEQRIEYSARFLIVKPEE